METHQYPRKGGDHSVLYLTVPESPGRETSVRAPLRFTEAAGVGELGFPEVKPLAEVGQGFQHGPS